MTALMYEDQTADNAAAASAIDELPLLTPATGDDRCDENCAYCWGPETD